jgi:hypothetical protein
VPSAKSTTMILKKNDSLLTGFDEVQWSTVVVHQKKEMNMIIEHTILYYDSTQTYNQDLYN